MRVRKSAAIGAVCGAFGTILLVLPGRAAHATILFSGWFYTSVTGSLPGESALVATGIFYDTVAGTAGAPTYDYIYEVANTGTAPIADFGIATGVPPVAAAPTYNSDTFFGFPPPPGAPVTIAPSGPVLPGAFAVPITAVPPATPPDGDGVGGKRLPGGWGGANNPFLGGAAVTPYTPLYPGGRGLISPNYQYFGFGTWNATGGYVAMWYNLVGNQIFNPRLVTRFDLNSIFGPVPGGAVIDPPSDPPPPDSFFDIGWADGGAAIDISTPDIPDPMTTFCTPDPVTCNPDPDSIPPDIAALNFTGFGAIPEPDSLSLFGAALLALGGIAYWRRRSSSRLASPQAMTG
jgi:PEP-CTERM motif